MDGYKIQNRAFWDRLATSHPATPFYKTDAFRRGDNILDPIARTRLCDVTGKRILHMQCHFGLDTLCLARMGAHATGIDFSSVAIDTARALSRETGVPAKFIEADVLNPPPELTGFDIAFASWGALLWIGDLATWMRNAARALKPDGRLILIEGHPAMVMLASDHAAPNAPFTVCLPYNSSEPLLQTETQGSYADPDLDLSALQTVVWLHGLEQILMSAIEAGFTIRKFEELDRIPWHGLPQLVKADDFYWALPEGAPFFPLAFALEAIRER
jgi:SAM-dependent methyltransferase